MILNLNKVHFLFLVTKPNGPYLHVLFSLLSPFSANLLLNGNWRGGSFIFVGEHLSQIPNSSRQILQPRFQNVFKVIVNKSFFNPLLIQSLQKLFKNGHLSTLHLFREVSFSSWYFYLFCGAGPGCIFLKSRRSSRILLLAV